jgi:uncharacterized protein
LLAKGDNRAMSRLLVLILLVVAAVWLVKRALLPKDGVSQKQSPPAPDELVACAHCGVHLPRSEARLAGGGLYCSEEHARLGKR